MADVPQTSFGIRRSHMAKKLVGNHNILRSQDVWQPWIPGVTHLPANSFPDPRLDFHPAVVLVKHGSYFFRSQALEDWGAYNFFGFFRINALFGNLHNLPGYIHCMHDKLQIRPRRADCPHNGVNLGSIAASHDGNSQRGSLRPFFSQSANQFEFRPVSKEESPVVLSSRRPQLDQGMQKGAIHTPRAGASQS